MTNSINQNFNKKNIAISGAGLVGSLLAIALCRKGHQVTIFEKRKDLRLEDTGAGKSINLIITAKGMKPLIDLGLWNKVKEITTPVIGRKMHANTGEITFQPYGRNPSECNYSVGRATLNKLLLTQAELAGAQVYFQSGVMAVDFKKKILTLENNEKFHYDLLFGTDGSGSVVRQELIRQLDVEHFEHGTPKADYKIEPLGTDYKELLLPRGKNGEYLLDPECLHIWPRGNHMLMGLPNLDGSFTMTLYMPIDWYKKFQSRVDVENYFHENYPDLKEYIPHFVDEYMEKPQGFLGVVRMRPWIYRDEVALLGDAAHAIVPFFGQGMNSGFLDVTYLLAQMEKGGDDYAQIFKNYETTQKLNGDAVADLSLENFVEMCDKVGDEKFLARKKLEFQIEQTFPTKYRSRYGMVTYTLTPYHLVKELGVIQNQILDELTKSPDGIDFKLAEKLIDEKLVPKYCTEDVSLERFSP